MDTGQTDAIYGVLLEMKQQMGEMRGDLKEIHSEVKRTNGRVTEAEKKIEGLDRWRTKVVAVAGVVALIGAWVWDMGKSFFGKN